MTVHVSAQIEGVLIRAYTAASTPGVSHIIVPPTIAYLTSTVSLSAAVTEEGAVLDVFPVMVSVTDLSTHYAHSRTIYHLTGATEIPMLLH